MKLFLIFFSACLQQFQIKIVKSFTKLLLRILMTFQKYLVIANLKCALELTSIVLCAGNESSKSPKFSFLRVNLLCLTSL